jgi:hypothetical protein
MISASQSLIENYIGYELNSKTFVYWFQGNGKTDMYLPIHNVTVAEDLYEYINPKSDGVVKEFELYKLNDLFYLYSESGFIYKYKISLTAGFTTIPNDIKQKSKEIISYMFRESGLLEGRMSGLFGVDTISQTMQGVTTNYKFKSMFNEIGKYLDKYRTVTL